MNIANAVTLLRLCISPIFLMIYLKYDALDISSTTLPYILLGLMGISELSDAFDGFLARRYNQVTELGKILDPMADSISRTTVFLTFTQAPVMLPIPLLFIFLYRDSVVSTLRTICALKGFALAARTSGKIKAVIQAIAAFIILLLMIPHSEGKLSQETLQTVSTWIVSVAALYTIYSGIDYIYANRHYIARMLVTPSNTASSG
ncbi:MAG: CDP-diacylglycerol--glycerol-3-phosphate 3-phosphatidyltransferase [Parachlamydia sp.]|nr:MAG: CDP-diacylglycerol--glycerol-3-phosphate 3-phosphatidyltransferase [Parachlamydia sp.]